MTRPPRVCLFVEFLYPVVSGGRIPFAGGIEVQLTLMGRGLAKRGFDVHVVTCDYGQPERLEIDGMTLHRAYPPTGGIPGLRFFHPRLTLGLSALWRADADVYLFRGAALWAGLVHAVARARGRRFVWLTGHDHDVLRSLPDVHGPRDRELVRRAIRGADAIVTQTKAQQERLRYDWALESTVIMNSVELPPQASLGDAGDGSTVLWLSTYKPEKRPEWFTRFAERHPHVRCRMVGVVPGTAAGGAGSPPRARSRRGSRTCASSPSWRARGSTRCSRTRPCSRTAHPPRASRTRCSRAGRARSPRSPASTPTASSRANTWAPPRWTLSAGSRNSSAAWRIRPCAAKKAGERARGSDPTTPRK